MRKLVKIYLLLNHAKTTEHRLQCNMEYKKFMIWNSIYRPYNSYTMRTKPLTEASVK